MAADQSEMKKEEVDDLDLAMHEVDHLPPSVARSPLYELPREIRERIYSFCLSSRDSLPVEWPRPSQWRIQNPYGLQPQLLRTCRIVRDEAAPLLYTLNNLTFHHPSDANIFVRAFASPIYAQQITNLSLHIKAQDMRSWMPYITSRDPTRSLMADFPCLRELGVRFRSAKWNQRETPLNNLKTWFDDSRLDEAIDGLCYVFFPPQADVNDRSENQQLPSGLELGTARGGRARARTTQAPNAQLERARPAPPIIRVCCACRVHPTQFTALTVSPDPAASQTVPEESAQQVVPVRENETFRGFTPIDLQNGVKKLFDAELGSANVSRTPYTWRKGVLLALEIHCIDPKKDPNERAV